MPGQRSGASLAPYHEAILRCARRTQSADVPQALTCPPDQSAGKLNTQVNERSRLSFGMFLRAQAAADRHCQGRMVAVHEGGYSELYVPFCGLAVIEQLARTKSQVRHWSGALARALPTGEHRDTCKHRPRFLMWLGGGLWHCCFFSEATSCAILLLTSAASSDFVHGAHSVAE